MASPNQDNHRIAPRVIILPRQETIQATAHMMALSRQLQGRT